MPAARAAAHIKGLHCAIAGPGNRAIAPMREEIVDLKASEVVTAAVIEVLPSTLTAAKNMAKKR
jgi:hypothetical protein